MHKIFASCRKLAVGVSLLLPMMSMTAKAQEVTGIIQGTITDQAGAAVPGAIVEASSASLGTPAKVTTDSRGFYRLNALPPGKYVVTATSQGMKAQATNLQLSAGDLPNLNLQMTIGAETSIDVSDTVAMVDVTQSKMETTVTQEILQAIPKTGRSFQALLTYAPGVRQEPLQSLGTGAVNGTSTPNAAGNSNIGGGASRQNGFQIDGASDSENLYLMDGVNITNIQGGGIGFNVPFEFIQEVSVKSSGIEAQYGGALGGVVNIIPERGTSNFHGSMFLYYRSSAMNANDQCAVNAACFLRYDPGTAAVTSTRTDAISQYYIARQDHYRYVDPGFTIGGPLATDKLHFFASYAPSFQRTRRDANSTNTATLGPHTYYQSNDTHLFYSRLDYAPTSKLRLFAGWEYDYIRLVGQLPNPDSKLGQLNSSASTSAATFRPDTGFVNPGSIYSAGADYVMSSKTLLSGRFGYYFNNVHTLGIPSGLRYAYSGSATATATSLSGSGIPAAYQNVNGFSNIAANQPTFFNAYKRRSFNVDLSHLLTGFAGTHNFKGGYSFTRTGNTVRTTFDYAYVLLFYSQAYAEGVPGSCNTIKAQNGVAYPSSASPNPNAVCRGNYGYFIVRDGNNVTGSDTSNAHGLYIQDDWTVGKGLTINAGVRLDREFIPPYQAGYPSIEFGWGSKIAPRIGGAWAFHNNKGKIFASYGKFYDILKFSLPQGSFGGNYWHDCVYTLDNPNFNLIVPTAPLGADGARHSCGATGLAPGVASNPVGDLTGAGGNAGRFIENLDLRASNNSTTDPGVDPNLKPTSQHEFTFGAEWSLTPSLVIKSRYVRKRLDETTEDIGLNDTFGYYIGNPGSAYADVLHRSVTHIYDQQIAAGQSPASQAGYANPAGICPQCPLQPGAIRNYDGLEFRVEKRTAKFFVTAFYTYSRLYGNYPGLTSTFATDGTGGRHNPNNNRSFDLPNMQFTAAGKPFGGPLPTDRPNAFSLFGSYVLKSLFGETRLGLSQLAASGSPVSTCMPLGGATTSACQFVEDQGGFVNYSRASNGDLVSNGVTRGRRTPVYTETGLNLTHYVKVSRDHENRLFGAEFNVNNLLNQHAVMGYVEQNTTAAVSAASTPTPANPTGTNYQLLMSGFDYTALANGSASLGSTGSRILNSQYGLPNLFQTARTIRIKLAYKF